MKTTLRYPDREHVEVYSEDNVEDILERNKFLRASALNGGDVQPMASVPAITLLEWLNEEWMRGNPIKPWSPAFYALVWRKLNDPNWKNLRTDGPRHRLGWTKWQTSQPTPT